MKRVPAAVALCLMTSSAIAQGAPPPPDKVTLDLTLEEAAAATELFDRACIASGTVRGPVCQSAQYMIGKVNTAAQPKPSPAPAKGK